MALADSIATPGGITSVYPAANYNDHLDKTSLKVEYCHAYLGSNQQLSNFTEGPLNRRETMPATRNLDKYLGLVIWIPETAYCSHFTRSSQFIAAFLFASLFLHPPVSVAHTSHSKDSFTLSRDLYRKPLQVLM